MSKKNYPKVVGKCSYCGNDIIAKYSAMDKPTRKYCSYKCSTTARNKAMTWTKAMRDKQAIACSERFNGRKMLQSTKDKLALANIGDKNPNWQGGKTEKSRIIRNSQEYKEWRTAVFTRDNYTCQICGNRSSKGNKVVLNADHIKSFAHYQDLRFDINNGLTLCLDCHKKTDTFGAKNLFKEIKQYSLNGKLIKKWKSLRFASKELNISATAIQNCLAERSKSSGNYLWKY